MGRPQSFWGMVVIRALRFGLLCPAVFSGFLAEGIRMPIVPRRLETFFVFLLYDVGLAPGAVVSLNISNAMPTNGTVLLILTRSQWDLWMKLPTGPISSYLISHWRQPFHDRLVARHHIRAVNNDHYYVGVLNVHREAILLRGEVAYVNPLGQYLPLQAVHLPMTLCVACGAFMGLMLAITLLLSLVWQRGATLLHALLLGCVWMKSVDLCLKWKCFDLLSTQGTAPAWRFVAWKLTSKLHVICEILLLLVTALGWRVLRPRLSAAETRCIILAMCLAVLVAMLQVASEVYYSDDAEPVVTFKWLFSIVQLVCYFICIFAMNFNFQLIMVKLAKSRVTPLVAVLYQKKQTYTDFRRLFLVVIFRPSAVLWLKLSVLNEGDMEWVADAFKEASLWFIYAVLFVIIRPGFSGHGLLDLFRVVAVGDAAEAAGDSPRGVGRMDAPMPNIADEVAAEILEEERDGPGEVRGTTGVGGNEGAGVALAEAQQRQLWRGSDQLRQETSNLLDGASLPPQASVSLDAEPEFIASYVSLAGGD